jgi:two-component system, OmpR family, sensor kinase
LPEAKPGTSAARTRAEMHRSIHELDQLIEEILLSSKLDALRTGKVVDIGDAESVDLIGLCAEECARVDAELHLQDGRFVCNVNGYARLLTRLVRNLLENAKRYTQGKIDLYLDVVSDGGNVRLMVCDQGPGVPVELRERIFEPFYRLPGASEREGGVGLGLALVKSIAIQHQGTVVCEDRQDGEQGACFTVIIPHAK